MPAAYKLENRFSLFAGKLREGLGNHSRVFKAEVDFASYRNQLQIFVKLCQQWHLGIPRHYTQY